MRIIFMGTPDFAVPVLDALVAAGHAVVAAYTQPPRPGGRRGRELVPSPVQPMSDAELARLNYRPPVTASRSSSATPLLSSSIWVIDTDFWPSHGRRNKARTGASGPL